MVSCPSGSTTQTTAGRLLTVAEAAIAVFGTKTPPEVWPFIGLAEFSTLGINDICTSPPADITFPTEQDLCDIGINFGGVVAGVCSTADPGRAMGHFVQWLGNQIWPVFCQCSNVASASCGTYSAIWNPIWLYNIRQVACFVPRPPGATTITVTTAGTNPVTTPLQYAIQTAYRIVYTVSGVLTYGAWNAIATTSAAGAFTGTVTTAAFSGVTATATGIQISTFVSAPSSATPETFPLTVSATYAGTCTAAVQNPTPGSGVASPVSVAPVVSSGCTTDTVCAKLDQVLWDLNVLLGTRPTTSPVNVINLYPNYQAGTVHAGLTGNGTLTVSNLLGLKVNVTAQPASLGSTGRAPVVYFNLGYITFGTVDGWLRPQKILTDNELFLPIDPRTTQIDYDLASGVTATLTELISV